MEIFLTDIEILDLINKKKQMTVEPDVLFLSMKENGVIKVLNMKCHSLIAVYL